MKQCLVCNNSLKFSRCVLVALILLAFLIDNHWLVLIAGFLMACSAFSIKLNIPYQIYVLFKKILKRKSKLIKKESGELKFIYIFGSSFFFVIFLLLHFNIDFAWIFVLIMSFLLILSCFFDICATSLIYAVLKKIRDQIDNPQT